MLLKFVLTENDSICRYTVKVGYNNLDPTRVVVLKKLFWYVFKVHIEKVKVETGAQLHEYILL